MTQMDQILALIKAGVPRDEYAEKTGLTEKQIQSAVNNLQFKGLVEAKQHRSMGRHRGRIGSEYRAIENPTKPPYKRGQKTPKDIVAMAKKNAQNSVFDVRLT